MTKFYRSSESGTEELVLTPRATDVETVADAIDLARYQHPECPRERPRPFSEANRSDREYATRLARAALAAAQAVAPEWKCKAQWTADPPQDCNWPFCGCDPYADKVLSAVDESGFAIVDTGTAKDAATAPAPWPTEEQVRQCIKRTMLDHSVGRYADNDFDLELARAVDDLYRNALFPKVQP